MSKVFLLKKEPSPKNGLLSFKNAHFFTLLFILAFTSLEMLEKEYITYFSNKLFKVNELRNLKLMSFIANVIAVFIHLWKN